MVDPMTSRPRRYVGVDIGTSNYGQYTATVGDDVWTIEFDPLPINTKEKVREWDDEENVS